MEEQRHIAHPFEPVFDERSRVLVLGTMPSPRSREGGFYYGHPQNRFWRVLAALFDEPVPNTNERKRDMLLRHHIALWDVLASCDIDGASDASIERPKANDLSLILRNAPVGAVFCTGAKSAELYAGLCEAETGISATRLPSTSPANAAFNLDDLVSAYRQILDYAHPFEPPTLDVADVVKLESDIAASGTSLAELMNRAGRALAHRAHAMAPSACAAVLCGSGNNGGDGWVAAAELLERGHEVVLVSAKTPDEIKANPAAAAARKAAVTLGESTRAHTLIRPDDEQLANALGSAGVIIDAVLGTGFNGENVKEPYGTWIREANRSRKSGAIIVAADVASGLSAQTGEAADPCITADATVTMIAGKPGLLVHEGPERSGDVEIAPLSYIEPLLNR